MGTNTLIKMCGVTSVADARMVLEAGADLVGLNLVGGSRQLTPAQAADILDALPQAHGRMVLLVSVREDGLAAEADDLCRAYPQCTLQLYEQVTPEVVTRFAREGRRVLLVHHVQAGASFAHLTELLAECEAGPAYVLLDAGGHGQLGGTGTRIDTETLTRAQAAGSFESWPPVILAGGLTPENVAEMLAIFHPAGVDVSSGVESTPGGKDPSKVRAFIAAVRQR